jgi:hypothetical protein
MPSAPKTSRPVTLAGPSTRTMREPTASPAGGALPGADATTSITASTILP